MPLPDAPWPEPDWPHAQRSRMAEAGGLRWHWQCWGEPDAAAGALPVHRPTLLLLHGTAASTHSWRALAPALASRGWQVVAPDLPGHAFSGMLPRPRRSLPGMASATAAWLAACGLRVDAVIGHSAGAALMLRMALDGTLPGARLLGLNAALLPFDGLAGLLYPPAARLLAANPLVPHLSAWRARDPRSVRRLVDACGSRLDDEGVALYARLLRRPAHIAGVLAMTAHWDLEQLARDLPRLDRPLHLLSGARDAAVPPAQARRLALRHPGVTLQVLEGLGHLAHEEAPQAVLEALTPWLIHARTVAWTMRETSRASACGSGR